MWLIMKTRQDNGVSDHKDVISIEYNTELSILIRLMSFMTR